MEKIDIDLLIGKLEEQIQWTKDEINDKFFPMPKQRSEDMISAYTGMIHFLERQKGK